MRSLDVRLDGSGLGAPREIASDSASRRDFRVLVAQDLADGKAPLAPGPFLASRLDAAGLGSASVLGAGENLADTAARCEAIVVGAQPFGEAELGSAHTLALRVVARHGAGFDAVDVAAMTRAGVMVTNTPLAVQRPVALMALTFILALAQSLLVKDRLTREGRWGERGRHVGSGVTGRTVGIIGAGGVGIETARLCRDVGLRILVARSQRNGQLAGQGFVLAPLKEVLAASDFLVLTCRLCAETRRLIDAGRLRLMKPTAYLVNVARGGVVDEAALIAALRDGTIAGAGLDVFEEEPVDPANPLLHMDNVVLAPHYLCVTQETLEAIAAELAAGLAEIVARRVPRNLVNPEVLAHPRVREWFGAGRNGLRRQAETVPKGDGS